MHQVRAEFVKGSTRSRECGLSLESQGIVGTFKSRRVYTTTFSGERDSSRLSKRGNWRWRAPRSVRARRRRPSQKRKTIFHRPSEATRSVERTSVSALPVIVNSSLPCRVPGGIFTGLLLIRMIRITLYESAPWHREIGILIRARVDNIFLFFIYMYRKPGYTQSERNDQHDTSSFFQKDSIVYNFIKEIFLHEKYTIPI